MLTRLSRIDDLRLDDAAVAFAADHAAVPLHLRQYDVGLADRGAVYDLASAARAARSSIMREVDRLRSRRVGLFENTYIAARASVYSSPM